VNDRNAYQLIGFGIALVVVGAVNLAVNLFGRAQFRQQVATAIARDPERAQQMRLDLLAEEGTDEP
jgi:hypothetical protein